MGAKHTNHQVIMGFLQLEHRWKRRQSSHFFANDLNLFHIEWNSTVASNHLKGMCKQSVTISMVREAVKVCI